MIGNTMSKEIFSKSRYNNFWSKSIIVIFVLLTTLGIYWKKKRILWKIPKSQKNVLTLKQTVAVIFLVYVNNLLTDYTLSIFPPSELLFTLEELRVILQENILTRLRVLHLDVEVRSEELLRQLSYAIMNQLGHPKSRLLKLWTFW